MTNLAKVTNNALAEQVSTQTESALIINRLAQEGVSLMPDLDQGFRFTLPRLGKWRLGIKVPTANGNSERPSATEYFVLPKELLENADFMEELAKHNNDPQKPTRIPIEFPCSVIGGNIRRSADLYGSSKGLLCRSYDGITCERVNQQTGEWTTHECTMHSGCPDFAKNACKWIHRVRVMAPHAPGIGVWQIDTPSPNNWATMLSEMSAIKGQVNGNLAGASLLLTLEPREFQIPVEMNGNKRLMKKTSWLMHVRSELSRVKLRESLVDAVDYAEEAIEWGSDTADDSEPIIEESDEPTPTDAPEEAVFTAEPEPVEESVDEYKNYLCSCKTLITTLGLTKKQGVDLFIALEIPSALKDMRFDDLKKLYADLWAKQNALSNDEPLPTEN
jgi:hypothetical protein